MLNADGTWKRRAPYLVPDRRYREERQRTWETYTVPEGQETHPRPLRNHARPPTELPNTARLDQAEWTAHPWDQTMDKDRCALAAQSAEKAFYHLTTQRVGAEPNTATTAWVNALSPNNLALSNATGDIYVKGTEPRVGAPPDDTIADILRQTPGGVRGYSTNEPPRPHTISAPPPKLIAPADVAFWPALEHSFPVNVAYPGFGVGLAVRALVYQTNAGWGTGALYYAVKKFTPLGPVANEPFALGLYAVPALLCTRMTVAVAQLFPAENIAVMDDFRGDQYSISFIELRSTKDPRYEIARRALLLQYPYLLTDLFATRLRAEPPPDMKPGGMVPPEMVANPPIMVAPPAQGDQAPQ